MNNRHVTKAVAAAIIAGLALSSAASHAATISTLFIPGLNTIQDQDAERFFDSNGTLKTSGGFAVGDMVEAILRFDSVNAAAISDTLAAPYQLTGYNQMRINAIDDLNGGALNLNDPIRLHFGYNPFGIGANVLGANVLVELYERTNGADPSFSLSALPNVGISNLRGPGGQTLISTFGFDDANDFWTATLINNIGALALAAPGSGQAAAGVFGLSQLPGGTLPILNNGILSGAPASEGGGGMHDVVGDLSVYARETGVNTGWLVSSNINASFNVPEPGTIAMMGLGLLGLAGFARRRGRATS